MSSVSGSGESTAVRSVLTALRTLEELSHGPRGVSELGRVLGVPKTTAHRSLRTLAQAGWVRPSEMDRAKWVLTARPLTVGLAGSVEGNLRELARGELTKLRDATGETIHLVIPDPPDLVVVARVDGTNSLRTFLPLGTHAPLAATASGRALLSAMSDAEVTEVLDAGLDRYTPTTILQRVEIQDAIALARERGYAVNEAEWRSDIAAIGVPVVARDGSPVAALAISMPLSRYEKADVASLAELAIGASRRIGDQLHDWKYSDTWIG